MSLSVYLTNVSAPIVPKAPSIMVRRNGAIVEVTREEWDQLHPGKEPRLVKLNDEGEHEEVFWRNITHNLGPMAEKAGLYKALWRPEEIGAKLAKDIIPCLTEGLELLKSDRARFSAFNPENGWGDYDGLVTFTKEYLSACMAHPDATISVSR